MGPHTFNFEQAAEWAIDAQAGLLCTDMATAMAKALAIAIDLQLQQQMSQAAQLFATRHRGAVAH
jgi:3-deoxy-D-manno-octulosonic-acid transferase